MPPIRAIARAFAIILIWELLLRWLLDWALGDRLRHPVELEPWNAQISIPLLNIIFVYCLWHGRRYLLVARSNAEALVMACVHGFVFLIVLQAPLRTDPLLEFIRSFSLALMLESAIAVAGLLAYASHEEIAEVFRRTRSVVVSTLAIALGLSILLPNFAVWVLGSGGSTGARAWFPFFIFAPAALLPFLSVTDGKKYSLIPSVVLGSLAVLTQTRTLLLIFVGWLALQTFSNLCRSGKRLQGLVVGVLFGGVAVGLYNSVPRLRAIELSDGVNGLNGRLELNTTLYETWLAAGPFGIGQEAVQQAIIESGSRATTEHGFIVWFSSYGALAILLATVLIVGAASAARWLVSSSAPRIAVVSSISALLFVTLSLWTALGSAGAASDWVGWIFIFMSIRFAPTTLRRIHAQESYEGRRAVHPVARSGHRSPE